MAPTKTPKLPDKLPIPPSRNTSAAPASTSSFSALSSSRGGPSGSFSALRNLEEQHRQRGGAEVPQTEESTLNHAYQRYLQQGMASIILRKLEARQGKVMSPLMMKTLANLEAHLNHDEFVLGGLPETKGILGMINNAFDSRAIHDIYAELSSAFSQDKTRTLSDLKDALSTKFSRINLVHGSSGAKDEVPRNINLEDVEKKLTMFLQDLEKDGTKGGAFMVSFQQAMEQLIKDQCDVDKFSSDVQQNKEQIMEMESLRISAELAKQNGN